MGLHSGGYTDNVRCAGKPDSVRLSESHLTRRRGRATRDLSVELGTRSSDMRQLCAKSCLPATSPSDRNAPLLRSVLPIARPCADNSRLPPFAHSSLAFFSASWRGIGLEPPRELGIAVESPVEVLGHVADVARCEDVLQLPEGGSGGNGSSSNTSTASPAILRACSASIRAGSSTIGPRDVLTTLAVGFIRANSGAPDQASGAAAQDEMHRDDFGFAE